MKEIIGSRSVVAVTLFFLAFLIFLRFWVEIKDNYGILVVKIASNLVALIKEVNVESIEKAGQFIEVKFTKTIKPNAEYRYRGDDIIKISTFSNGNERYYLVLNTSVNYFSLTFNSPLTIALMVAYYPFLKKKDIYIEVVLLLITVHFLYAFSQLYKHLSLELAARKHEEEIFLNTYFWIYFASFTHKLLLRFEPFLLGFYIYLRSHVHNLKGIRTSSKYPDNE